MATDTIIRERRGAVKPDDRWVAALLRAETAMVWRMSRRYRRERNEALTRGDLDEANRCEKWRLADVELFGEYRRIVRLARRLTEETR